jgi:hypothetical protein
MSSIRITNTITPFKDVRMHCSCKDCTAEVEFGPRDVQKIAGPNPIWPWRLYKPPENVYVIVCPGCDMIVDVGAVIPVWVKKRIDTVVDAPRAPSSTVFSPGATEDDSPETQAPPPQPEQPLPKMQSPGHAGNHHRKHNNRSPPPPPPQSGGGGK